jgi:hypothetical protein
MEGAAAAFVGLGRLGEPRHGKAGLRSEQEWPQ